MKLLVAATLAVVGASQNVSCAASSSLYDGSHSSTYINGTGFNLKQYQGQVLLITNVASFWGETVSHYTGLNAILASINNPNFSVLGFPCNQFGGQEPGDNSEILNILKYVRPGGGFVPNFPLTQIVNVNGALADSTWNFIRAACPSPTSMISPGNPAWAPITASDFTWNFNSVLVDKNGFLYRRYDTLVQPQDQVADIMTLLSR